MRARGFTLIELLVALLVMAVLGVMSWRGLDGMATTVARNRVRSDQVQVLQSGLAQWGADLDAMATQLPTALDWNGQALRITRRGASTGVAGLQVVAWTTRTGLAGKQLLRWQSPLLRTSADLQRAWVLAAQWAQSPSAASQAAEVVVVPVTDLQVFYFRGGAWSNSLSSSDAALVLPDGVRLQLDLAPGQALSGRITRDWIRPTLVHVAS